MKRLVLPIAIALAACAHEAPKPSQPPTPSPAPTQSPPQTQAPSPPPRQSPPPALAAKPAPFPHVATTKLANGLELATVEAHALPVVEIRVFVRAGSGYAAPGVGDVTGEMLKEGGTRARSGSEVLRRVESLGTSLGVEVDEDGTTLSLGVLASSLDDALAILGEIVRTPRFDARALDRVKGRMADQVRDALRGSGGAMVRRLLFSTLYPKTSPYARALPLPEDVTKVDGRAIADFHRKWFVPSNATIVIAGDVSGDAAKASVEKAFGSWAGAAAPKRDASDFPAPAGVESTRVIVADRPKSVQSDVVVTQLLPDRHAASWPVVRVALHVLGGGMTGRLFTDVREKRSLAYAAQAQVLELAHGDQPLFAYAGTQTPKTADSVQGVLDDMASMKSAPPSDDEVARARTYLSDIFAVRMETIGAIAGLVTKAYALDLPLDGGRYWDDYRAAIRAVPATEVDATAARVFRPDKALILVAGDADAIAEPLARFGEVTVVDPEHDFRVIKTVPKR